MLRLGTALGSALFLATAPAYALSTTFTISAMTGATEVPGPGDPDGFASGSITLDDGPWTFLVVYLLQPRARVRHAHPRSEWLPRRQGAGVFVGLGAATTGGPGTLINSTTTSIANINAILANPNDFYVNIHTNPGFPAGAVRGQVPEPGPAQLIGFGVVALGWMRRQQRRSRLG